MKNIPLFIFGLFLLINLSFAQKKVQTYYEEYGDKLIKEVYQVANSDNIKIGKYTKYHPEGSIAEEGERENSDDSI